MYRVMAAMVGASENSIANFSVTGSAGVAGRALATIGKALVPASKRLASARDRPRPNIRSLLT
jgi:hypothetical protein